MLKSNYGNDLKVCQSTGLLERARRKALGIFYTPLGIANYIANRCISEILVPRISQLISVTKSSPAPKSNLKKINDILANLPPTSLKEIGENILPSLRICDPSCGNGAFLVAAGSIIAEMYQIAGFDVNGNELRQAIIRNNLFGFDIDSQAVNNTRQVLWNWTQVGIPYNKEQFDEIQVIQKNSLFLGNTPIFDIIIGNPPYISMTSLPESQKAKYAQRFNVFHANGDLYYLFLEQAFSFLKPGGMLGFIVPRYFLKAPTATRLRLFLAKKRCQSLEDPGQNPTFPGVGIHPLILFYENTPPCPFDQVQFVIHEKNAGTRDILHEEPYNEERIVNANTLTADPWTFPSAEYLDFRARIESEVQGNLSDFCTIAKGVQTGKDDIFVVSEKVCTSWEIEPSVLRPWIKNGDISPYCIHPKVHRHVIFSTTHTGDAVLSLPHTRAYLESHEDELRKRSRVSKWYQWRKGDERVTIDWNAPKLVGPYKGHSPVFALDLSGAYFSQDIVLIQPHDCNETYLPFFLAFLNSKIAAWVAQYEFKELAQGIYEFYPTQLAKLPIVLPSCSQLEKINIIIKRIEQSGVNAQTSAFLEQYIKEVYGETD